MSAEEHTGDRTARKATAGTLRLSGYAGVAFFVWLVFAGVVVGGILPMPTFADTAAYHRHYYLDEGTLVLLHAWFSGLFWAFSFLIFAAGLRQHLEGHTVAQLGFWPRLLMSGVILAVAFGGTGLVFQSVATSVASEASDEILKVLARMVVIADSTLLYWGLAVFITSASMATLRSGGLKRWIAWLGFVSASLMVVGALWPLTGDDRGALAGIGFLGLISLGVWILIAAINLLRAASHSEQHTDVRRPE